MVGERPIPLALPLALPLPLQENEPVPSSPRKDSRATPPTGPGSSGSPYEAPLKTVRGLQPASGETLSSPLPFLSGFKTALVPTVSCSDRITGTLQTQKPVQSTAAVKFTELISTVLAKQLGPPLQVWRAVGLGAENGPLCLRGLAPRPGEVFFHDKFPLRAHCSKEAPAGTVFQAPGLITALAQGHRHQTRAEQALRFRGH